MSCSCVSHQLAAVSVFAELVMVVSGQEWMIEAFSSKPCVPVGFWDFPYKDMFDFDLALMSLMKWVAYMLCHYTLFILYMYM